MARIRTVKPEFWESEDIGKCSETARLVAIALLNFADDEGYFKASEAWIRSRIFVYQEPVKPVPIILAELEKSGWVRLFKSTDGHEYGVIINFRKHQVINKPTPSAIKKHDMRIADNIEVGNATVALPEDYRSPTVVLPEDYRLEGKGREGKGTGKGKEQGGSRARGDGQQEPEAALTARDPARPDKDIPIEDWKKACRCADLIEGATSDVPVSGRGGNLRATAFAYLAEAKLGKPWRDPWIVIEATVEGLCKSSNANLRRILDDLRRYPDGAYPDTTLPNQPSRIEQASRLILPDLVRNAGKKSGAGKVGTFSSPELDCESLRPKDLQDESGFL